ncbi:MAG: archaeosine biosynthesis radical SAM protein RaSEA [Promethearchaeota archaeon]
MSNSTPNTVKNQLLIRDQNIKDYFQDESMIFLESQPPIVKNLWEELIYLRNRPLSKQKAQKMTQIDRPVASFSKPERLRDGMGTEITLIFRSSACSWAASKSGGCTMCGYWNDRADKSISGQNFWNQFSQTITKYQNLLEDSSQAIVFKMFTSGSFCDPKELDLEIQLQILRKLSTFTSVKEIVIESRPEYIQDKLLEQYKEILTNQYLEIGVGLESRSDYVRNNIINKGFSWDQFVKATNRLHQYGFGVKAYLIFKPPFLPEYAAMIDLFNSVRACVELGADTISINPINIQQHTICEVLHSRNQFRSPWLFSLLWVIKNSFSQEELQSIRLICDPSAAGKDRGVHNFDPYHPSNEYCLKILEKFVHNQDLSVIPEKFPEKWWIAYRSELLSQKK